MGSRGVGADDRDVAHFETSLRLKPDNVQALLNLAHVEEQRGRLDAAASRLRAALKVDPTDTTPPTFHGAGETDGFITLLRNTIAGSEAA